MDKATRSFLQRLNERHAILDSILLLCSSNLLRHLKSPPGHGVRVAVFENAPLTIRCTQWSC